MKSLFYVFVYIFLFRFFDSDFNFFVFWSHWIELLSFPSVLFNYSFLLMLTFWICLFECFFKSVHSQPRDSDCLSLIFFYFVFLFLAHSSFHFLFFYFFWQFLFKVCLVWFIMEQSIENRVASICNLSFGCTHTHAEPKESSEKEWIDREKSERQCQANHNYSMNKRPYWKYTPFLSFYFLWSVIYYNRVSRNFEKSIQIAKS